jgi:hypothetical protein
METGQCSCGAFQYRLDGSLGPIANCHCRSCRRAHGAAFATGAVVRSAELKVTAGEDCLREYPMSNGARYFCARCGGRLFKRSASNPGITILMVTSLNDEPEAGPIMHFHVKSKAPWYEILDNLPQYETRPPPPETKS